MKQTSPLQQLFLSEYRAAYGLSLATLLESAPSSIDSLLAHLQLLASVKQLKLILDWDENLKKQIENEIEIRKANHETK